jgi:hypothetical protein
VDAPALPPKFVQYRSGDAVAVDRRNRDYPLVVAATLDALAAAGGSYARAAQALGLSTSQLMKFLRSNDEVWRAVEDVRAGP